MLVMVYAGDKFDQELCFCNKVCNQLFHSNKPHFNRLVRSPIWEHGWVGLLNSSNLANFNWIMKKYDFDVATYQNELIISKNDF